MKEIARLTQLAQSGPSACAMTNAMRINAILGARPRSLPSFVSAVRCWIGFARVFLQKNGCEFPPTVDELLAWSVCFRCRGTFSNYLSCVRTACHLVRVSDEAFTHHALRAAKISVEKRSGWVARKRLAIREELLVRIIDALMVFEQGKAFAMLFLTAYVFALRLPSEALPMVWSAGKALVNDKRSVLQLSGQELRLTLARRKNRERPTHLLRSCWCSTQKKLCPIHALGAWFQTLSDGATPFAHITPARARHVLRTTLKDLAVAEAMLYGTHAFRRGHVQDVIAKGGRVTEVLLAGDWRSPAFFRYVDAESLERDAVVEAHVLESDSEEEGATQSPR